MTDATKTNLDKKVKEVHMLDTATQDLLSTVRNKNSKAIGWFIVCWTILFTLGIFGIFYQNQIARSNKKHIDCIVKLFTTPLPSDAHSRQIFNAQTTCDIKFTQ